MCPLSFLGSDTPILDVVLISDLTVSVDRFRLNLTGSYERKADLDHSKCAGPLQTNSRRSGLSALDSDIYHKRKLICFILTDSSVA